MSLQSWLKYCNKKCIVGQKHLNGFNVTEIAYVCNTILKA